MVFRKVAIVGANGKISKPLVQQLLGSHDITFEVSVMTRSSPVDVPAGVKVHQVNYDDHASLVAALEGTDVILSTLPATISAKVDHQLAAAGLEAGVRRIFPSEYTLDLLHPNAVAIFADREPRAASYKQFVEDAAKGGLSFTYVIPGGFIEYGLTGYMGTVDLKAHTMVVVDEGTYRATGCTTDFIAACVVAALKMPEEETKNKRIRVAEVEYSGNEMMQVLEEVTGAKFTAQHVTSEQLLENSRLAFEKGDMRGAYINKVLKVNFDGEGAGLLSDGLEWDAGGRLQVKRKSLLEIAQNVVAGLE